MMFSYEDAVKLRDIASIDELQLMRQTAFYTRNELMAELPMLRSTVWKLRIATLISLAGCTAMLAGMSAERQVMTLISVVVIAINIYVFRRSYWPNEMRYGKLKRHLKRIPEMIQELDFLIQQYELLESLENVEHKINAARR